MTKSRVDEIAEQGLKKLEVWYKVHTKKKYVNEKKADPDKDSDGKSTSYSASSDYYRSSINLNKYT
ncbi:MAG: hypothetical protein PVI26_07040 [Chitinispirillia bacterium]|jgi:hypothetical protein